VKKSNIAQRDRRRIIKLTNTFLRHLVTVLTTPEHEDRLRVNAIVTEILTRPRSLLYIKKTTKEAYDSELL
jgi:hypothetical protein